MKKLLLILAFVVVLIGAGALYLVLRNRTAASEAVELLEQGEEERLREELRAVQGGPRVLLIALDGVGEEQLRGAVTGGAMPQLAALLGEPGSGGVFAHGYAAPDVLSILPSTTMAAWSSIYSGEPPGRTGVPGNEWFVREEMRFVAPAPVSVTDHAHTLKMYTDGLVGNAIAAPTLFERAGVRAYVTLAPVYRGADLFSVPDAGAVAELFGEVARGVTQDAPVTREVYSEVDLEGVENSIQMLGRHGLPTLQVVYFPGVDLFTHGAEDPLRQQRQYLRDIVDPAIGRLLEAYRAAGALDSTYVVVTADHGHTPVIDDDRHALEAEGADEPTEVLRQGGFRLRPLVLDQVEDGGDFQAAVAYQGAIAYVYLADRSTCPNPGQRCDWRRPPRLTEDVLPVARAFQAASRTGAGVPALRGAIDLVFARVREEGGTESVRVLDGGRLVPVADWLRRNRRPDLLDLERRMDNLMLGPHGNRAGDVLLLARSGADVPIQERFYFSGLYHSWHGSPSASDSRVPLVVARSGASGAQLRERVRAALGDHPDQLGVTPLVLRLLNRDAGARR